MKRPTRAAVSACLRRIGRPAGAFDASRYFRASGDLRFHNVGATNIRALARTIHQENREQWTVASAMRFADDLMADPYLETKAVGISVLARFRRSFTPSLLAGWKRWLANDLAANWATTDQICGELIGPALTQYPDLLPLMRTWATHRNLWVRRASAVALIPSIRKGRGIGHAYAVATTLRQDPHDLIHKAVGWMLREASKQDPVRLERYLLTGGAAIPRTTVRYAIERFPPEQRRRLLLKSRNVSN